MCKVSRMAQSFQIENDSLSLVVSSLGAEMKSLFNKAWKREVLWAPKDEAAKKIWNRTSPILFPVIGQLKDDQYVLKEKVYKMPKHGFARDYEFECVSKTRNELTFKLVADQTTFAMYPFCFELFVTYTLEDRGLQIAYAVKNVDRQDIYFSIGAHPAFATTDLSDYEIIFEKKERGFFLLEDNLVNLKKLTALTSETILPTVELFKNDALIFKDLKSKHIDLKNLKTREVIRVSGTNTPYLGIWGKDSVPFICIEPWYGICDSADHDGNFESKNGIQTLAESSTFRFSFSISFPERFPRKVPGDFWGGSAMKKVFIPLTNRGFSGDSDDNILLKDDRTYLMDNHRLALWCWFQEIKKGERYNLFHIDAHPDMNESALAYFDFKLHDMWNLSLEDYRNAWQSDIHSRLFRWDNYLEIFLQKYPQSLGLTMSATHHLGSAKGLSEEVKPIDLAKRMHEIFSGKKYLNDLSWIVNLDLDYFFSAQPEKFELFSDEYVDSIAASLRSGLDSGMIRVLTIALSPECCGSWEKAEAMLKRFHGSLLEQV